MNHSNSIEACGNVSSKTPKIGQSPLTNEELINSPFSPDYPPPVSVGPTSPDTTYATSVALATATTTDPTTTQESDKCMNNKVVKREMDKNLETVIKIESEVDVKNETCTSNKCNDIKYSSEVQVKHEPPDKVDVKLETDWSSTKSVVDSTITSCQATANSTVNTSHGKSHSSSSSSSRDKKSSRDQSDKRHCSRCYRRSKIKRASIGVQCKRDRRNSSSINTKSSSQAMSLGNPGIDNMRLNLQTKTCKVLGKQNKFECLESLKYKKFINIETYPNGGATVVHMYQDEIDTLTKEQVEELAQEFFKVSSSFYSNSEY